jgi:hypothetical protein
VSSKSPWPQEYYNALEFYYWEPQWLNRHAKAAPGENKLAEVLNKVRQSEVALNHLVSLFFSIAPNGLVRRFFGRFLTGWSSEAVETHGHPKLDIAQKVDICQTDLLFEGVASMIAVEMKIRHKTSLDQIIKYALFLHHYGKPHGKSGKQPFLLFLSPSAAKVWSGGLTFSTYRTALAGEIFSPTVQRFADMCGHHRDDVLGLATSLPVFHLSYYELQDFLDGEVAASDKTDGGETLRNLVGGLVSELTRRGLVGAVSCA